AAPTTTAPPAPETAGDHVLAHLHAQADALLTHDAAVRRSQPDGVHQMRVASRRLRSALRSFRSLLDRTATDPLIEELRWLGRELGAERDQEVLEARLRTALDAVPRPLLLGPVRGRLRRWSAARSADSHGRTLDVLDSPRYLSLLDSLDALLTDPPLRGKAAKDPGTVLAAAVLKDHARLADRVEHALSLPPGPDRDLALHSARKAAKRTRYAAELARPALGKPAKRLVRRLKKVQDCLGDHQDSVVAREALRDLAVQAHAAGEPSFPWGLLYGREEAAAAAREQELPELWRRVSVRGLDT
ncbi:MULTISPECIES: CHAD domain-containing protein, partial [unclassified Streptomyces]|uniref:CHAD domain-containing protein n=1 Tax=unclassified Streptomyces TaxID=2593676 RepID=UPI00115F807E